MLQIPQHIVRVCRTLQEAGHRAVVVGGAVRSLLIKQKYPDAPGPKDYDVATSALPSVVADLFGIDRTIPTGIAHGTVTVVIGKEEGGVEVTTLRREGAYSDGRRPDKVTFVGSLEEDLARRDFTMNAIAYDPLSGELVDPFGGRTDIEDKIIRAVGDSDARFAEDGLRLLRAVRFAAQLNFVVCRPTYLAMASCKHFVRKVSRERVRDEVLKLLAAPALMRGLDLLHASGLLQQTIPELHTVLDKTLSSADWMLAVDRAPPHLRFAALIWPLRHLPRGDLARVLSSFKLPTEQVDLTLGAFSFPHVGAEATPCYGGFPAVRRIMAAYPRKIVDAALALQEAWDPDEKGLHVFRSMVDEVRTKKHPLTLSDLAVDGKFLIEMGVGPGPKMGEILRELLRIVVENPEMNDRDLLIGFVMGMSPLGAP